MRLTSITISLVLVLLTYQSPKDTIRQHYEAAEVQRRAGNLAGAESEFTAILGEAYARLGGIYSAQEDYKRALPVLESAASYRPDSSEVLLSLAIACFGAGQYDKALDAARKLLVIDPQNAGAHQMLGKSYFMLGDLGKSISELEAALKLAPDDVDVVYTLGIAYLRNRQSAEARQLYESMIKQFGDRPQFHIIIGRAYRQSGLMAEAADEFKKAIALDKNFPRSHYYLGITYLMDEGQTKVNEALKEFQIELAANPDEFFANYYLGIVYIFQRKWDLAVTFLQKASTIEPNNPDPYFQLGQAYQELNQHERTIEVLKKSIALNPNLAHNKNQVTKAHLILAQALLRTGQTAAGQKELQIAADLKLQAFKLEQQTPGSKPAADPGGLAVQEPALLEASFEPRVNSKPLERDDKTIQDLKNAATYYEQVLATAHNNVGMLRGERQDFSAAAEQFALAVKWNPNQEGLNYNLGLAYYKSGLFEKSIPPLENEVKTHPENRPAAILLGTSYFNLGQALLQRGDLSGAINNLESAAKFAPENPDVHYHLGQAYLAAGRKTEGKSQIDLANQLKSKTSKSDNK